MEVTGEVERSDSQEVGRLLRRYKRPLVEALFGKGNFKLPATFEEAMLLPTEPVDVTQRFGEGVR